MSTHSSKGHPGMDFDEQKKIYAGFQKVSKYSTVAIVAIFALMTATLA